MRLKGVERVLCGILGDKDEPILGIYSHMIDYHLFIELSIGHLISFQVEQAMSKNMADEIQRMYKDVFHNFG